MTVTGTRALPSPHTWVIPSLVPSSPEKVRVALDMSRSLELDLDVDVGGQVEAHERVDRLRRRIDDVDQPLVRAHLEVLAAVLVLVRRSDNDDHVLLRGERHRADDLGARTRDRVDDLPRRAVEPRVVVRLQSDADLLSRHGFLVPCAPEARGSWLTGRLAPRPRVTPGVQRDPHRCSALGAGAPWRAPQTHAGGIDPQRVCAGPSSFPQVGTP